MLKTIDMQHQEEYWQAICNRDTSYDGVFVFAVKTTGIYCRPSCPARRAKRENVVFFNLNKEAEAAGFRACLRCQPKALSQQQRQSHLIEKACDLIAQSETTPRLHDLADAVSLSPYYFQRLFKRHLGMTPKQYSNALQDKRVRSVLPMSKTITQAVYESGFEQPSQFYKRALEILGMSPSDYKKKGQTQLIWYTFAQSDLGLILIAGTTRGICALRFGACEETLIQDLRETFSKAQLIKANENVEQWVNTTVSYIKMPDGVFELPLDIQGTTFQHQVWQALRTIPAGITATYAEIAQKIGKPKAVRAVANACAANSVAVAVPCHRVVRTDGASGGYRWGVERKAKLLQLELKQRSTD